MLVKKRFKSPEYTPQNIWLEMGNVAPIVWLKKKKNTDMCWSRAQVSRNL